MLGCDGVAKLVKQRLEQRLLTEMLEFRDKNKLTETHLPNVVKVFDYEPETTPKGGYPFVFVDVPEEKYLRIVDETADKVKHQIQYNVEIGVWGVGSTREITTKRLRWLALILRKCLIIHPNFGTKQHVLRPIKNTLAVATTPVGDQGDKSFIQGKMLTISFTSQESIDTYLPAKDGEMVFETEIM